MAGQAGGERALTGAQLLLRVKMSAFSTKSLVLASLLGLLLLCSTSQGECARALRPRMQLLGYFALCQPHQGVRTGFRMMEKGINSAKYAA